MGKFKYEVYDYSKIGICKPKKFQTTVNIALSEVAERELAAFLSEQIAREIDRSIVEFLNVYSNG